MALFQKEHIDRGLQLKIDRQYRLRLKRVKGVDGQYIYHLNNMANHDALTIPFELMDRFRVFLYSLNAVFNEAETASGSVDEYIAFKETKCFRAHTNKQLPNVLIIYDLLSPSRLSIPIAALGDLSTLLYDNRVEHTNGTFDRILEYHKLFQFTFEHGSDSMTSRLALRKQVLVDMEDYKPQVKTKYQQYSVSYDVEAMEAELKQLGGNAKLEEKQLAPDAATFQSKLGERSDDENYNVDYDLLFSRHHDNDTTQDQTQKKHTVNKAGKPSYLVPLLAADIKAFKTKVFKCELSTEDAKIFRSGFLGGQNIEILMGIEIFTAIYRSEKGKLRCFRFPLYYMPVQVHEAGRVLHVNAEASGDIYLNHLGLANFVERFSKSKAGDPVEKFFSRLLQQNIEVSQQLKKLSLHRKLPFSDEIYRQTRETLIGREGENGHGGILEDLNIIGVEVDLDSVVLYRTERSSSLLVRALEYDLDRIHDKAKLNADEFYLSLLGQIFNREKHSPKVDEESFCSHPQQLLSCLGPHQKVNITLAENLNKHDLILLEGPPGTGKTHTIQNLFFHCLSTGKRLLVVSDQASAIHALTEKLHDTLAGDDLSSEEQNIRLNLWNAAIKVVDEIPQSGDNLASWATQLSTALKMELSRAQDTTDINDDMRELIRDIDRQDRALSQKLETTFAALTQRGNGSDTHVCARDRHPHTEQDINELKRFLEYISASSLSRHQLGKETHPGRLNALAYDKLLKEIAQEDSGHWLPHFRIEPDLLETCLHSNEESIRVLNKLLTLRPCSKQEFLETLPSNSTSKILHLLVDYWDRRIPEDKPLGAIRRRLKKLIHPCAAIWKQTLFFCKKYELILQALAESPHHAELSWAFSSHYDALVEQTANKDSSKYFAGSPAFDCVQFLLKPYSAASVQNILQEISALRAKRDKLMQKSYFSALQKITRTSYVERADQTNLATTIVNALESLKACEHLDSGAGLGVWDTLQKALMQCFPIWICRKQAVPFLFPSEAGIFDLVIVDEAGQCRVDDAIPLIHRAKKLMVVGDDKQTVLDKNSVVDDYLFKEFELEEHLRTTQTRGVKGGGSNLFDLVKSIKRGGVFLDEHYRCPPAIIAYSNRYVYHSNLKIMQWQQPNAPAPVVVDFSEKKAKQHNKATRGKYKGIETDMLDRFMVFVSKSIRRIEKEIGRNIDLNSEVALCYFLLKNEPYIKDKKPEFIAKLKRGTDVLDGAGAALQGKERDYIFYLWDINSSNISFFRQGDDPDKRKGELNVLMSRPRKRAFHYLHGGFDTLKHESASITDYLWTLYNNQFGSHGESNIDPSQTLYKSNSAEQASSAQSMFAILSYLMEARTGKSMRAWKVLFNVVVGNPRQKVDIMFINETSSGESRATIALVELGAFRQHEHPHEEIAAYYFQLQRTKPQTQPVFCFFHELCDPRSEVFQILEEALCSI